MEPQVFKVIEKLWVHRFQFPDYTVGNLAGIRSFRNPLRAVISTGAPQGIWSSQGMYGAEWRDPEAASPTTLAQGVLPRRIAEIAEIARDRRDQ